MVIFIARGGKGGGGGGEKFVGDHAVFQGKRRVISCRQQSLKWVGGGWGWEWDNNRGQQPVPWVMCFISPCSDLMINHSNTL